MRRKIELEFLDEGIKAQAELFDDTAPKTAELIWGILPLAGDCWHGIYSGTVVAMFFDPSLTVPEENATWAIQTGDLMFTHYEPDFRHGHAEPVSEIYWAYDRYARPHIPGQWVPCIPNIFGRFLGDPAASTTLASASARRAGNGWRSAASKKHRQDKLRIHPTKR